MGSSDTARWWWVFGELLVGGMMVVSVAVRLAVSSWHTRQLRRAEVWRQWVFSEVSAPDAPSGRRDQPPQCPLSVAGRTRVLSSLAKCLRGDSHARLARLADELGLRVYIARYCRSRLYWRRLRGLRLMTLCAHFPVTELQHLCADRRAVVRAQVAETLAHVDDERLLGLLITMLGDPHPFVRVAVQDSLTSVGQQIVEPLARYLETASQPGLEAGLVVAQHIPSARFLPLAQRIAVSEEARLRVLAAQVFGAVGGAVQQQQLETMLKDPDAVVRATAVEQLRRLRAWTAAGAIAPLVADSDWQVRRDAALALRSFGPPGLVHLRAALQSGNSTAESIARYVLSLPADTCLQPLPFETQRRWDP